MLKITIGFFFGVVITFIIVGVIVIVMDERRIRELKDKVKER